MAHLLFQQDNVPIPVIWQETVCKLVMSYPLNWPSGPISNQPRDIRDCQVHDLYPITQIIGTPAGLTMTTHSTGAGVQMYTKASSEHAQKADRMQF